MKLTTDRHEASHGLFETAELLVLKIREVSGKNLVRENLLKLFIVSCILASRQVFSSSTGVIRVPLKMPSAAEECRKLSENFTLYGEWSPCYMQLDHLGITEVSLFNSLLNFVQFDLQVLFICPHRGSQQGIVFGCLYL